MWRCCAKSGRRCGIAARAIGPVLESGLAVSSSRIRDALKAGDCALAERLLTRPFAVRGQVIHGDKRGRSIGFPTANLDMGQYLRPRYGIYAVSGRVLATGQMLQGAANLGIRPSFDPPREVLEPYFFDFSGDLYGQEIEVASATSCGPRRSSRRWRRWWRRCRRIARRRGRCWKVPHTKAPRHEGVGARLQRSLFCPWIAKECGFAARTNP